MNKLVLILCVFLSVAEVTADTLTDPTKPILNVANANLDASNNPMPLPGLKLTAIINKQQYNLAIINGQSFLEGQQVQGYDVVVISQNHVILSGSEGKKTLYVNNNNVKKDANYGY